MASFPDQETVIRKVGKAYDQIKQLRALLQFKPRKLGDDLLSMHQLAQPLFEEALQGLNHSLHIMKSGSCKKEVKQEIMGTDSGVPGNGSVLFDDFGQRIANKRGKRRRTEDDSWTCMTTMPYDDGYQWRKYGEKKMGGTNSSRSYFRCTFKEEQGCLAKKLVQETTSNGTCNVFHVTYTNKHTCNSHIPSPVQLQELQSDVYEQIHKRNICMPHYMPSDNSVHDSPREDEAPSSYCAIQSSGEWDVEALIMELVGFDSVDTNFLLN